LSVLGTLEHRVQDRGPEQGLRQPDLTLWFDLDPAVAAVRLAGARAPDRFESESGAFFARVASGYAARAQADPRRFARIPADQTPEQVSQAVRAVMVHRAYLPAAT
jgi:dTMP kinase